jgi:hypothetical protein
VIKFTSCLSMVSGSLWVLWLLPPLKLVAKKNQSTKYVHSFKNVTEIWLPVVWKKLMKKWIEVISALKFYNASIIYANSDYNFNDLGKKKLWEELIKWNSFPLSMLTRLKKWPLYIHPKAIIIWLNGNNIFENKIYTCTPKLFNQNILLVYNEWSVWVY